MAFRKLLNTRLAELKATQEAAAETTSQNIIPQCDTPHPAINYEVFLNAASDNNIALLKEMIAAGALKKTDGIYGKLALFIASWLGHLEAVTLLWENLLPHTDRHNLTTHFNLNGTPLKIKTNYLNYRNAFEERQYNFEFDAEKYSQLNKNVRNFLKYYDNSENDLFECSKNYLPVLYFYSKQGCNVVPLALIEAASLGENTYVKYFLEFGIDIPLDGETALMHAAKNGHASTIQLLLDHGAKINNLCILAGETALMKAAKNGHVQAVQKLWENGANISLHSISSGKTAAQLAEAIKDKNIKREILNLLSQTQRVDKPDSTAAVIDELRKQDTSVKARTRKKKVATPAADPEKAKADDYSHALPPTARHADESMLDKKSTYSRRA